MDTKSNDTFELKRPAALIAALPAVLGFVPERSLVVVTVDRGALGCVMRVDLSSELSESVGHIAEVAAAARPDAAIAVIVDDEGAACRMCNDEYSELVDQLRAALSDHGIELLAAHVVDRVAAGGRWHCVDGCGNAGVVDDPAASPLAMAAVLDGRRLYQRRSELHTVIGVSDPEHTAALAQRIDQQPEQREDGARDDVEHAITAARRVADGAVLADDDLVRLGRAVADRQVRDVLFGLAAGEEAGAAEALWSLLSRALPEPSRVEALALLALSAYARGDGPLAGVALEEAQRLDPEHRMACMLDTALQSGIRPEKVRELALAGYRVADQLGVEMPPRRPGN